MANALYPCTPWPINPVCCPGWPADPTQWTQAHRDAQYRATTYLWRATGGLIGLCRSVVRPCLDECVAGRGSGWGGWMMPYIRDGEWFNSLCGCTSGCSCSELCTVTLPGPVHLIESITVAGQVVPPSDWRQITGDRVARVNGGCWPSCQDLRVPDADGFTITYQRGIPPGLDAIAAVSKLACKYLDECPPDGGGDCGELPEGVESVSREGLTMRFGDNDSSLDTGIRAVSDFIASVNPYGLTEYPSVWSPDVDEPLIFYEGPVT